VIGTALVISPGMLRRDISRRFIIIIFLTPVLNSRGMKKLRYAIQKKYKNQAGIEPFTPPPSQNSHAIRWHYTAESKRRVAEIKS